MVVEKNINLDELIIWQDDDIIALNKPAGLIVNNATTHQQTSLQQLIINRFANEHRCFDEQWLAANRDWLSTDFITGFGSPLDIWRERQGMVHRLDKDTSGIVLWAKNPIALVNLLAQFRLRQTTKEYQCLAHGWFGAKQTGRINLPLGRKLTNRQLMAVTLSGRSAVTEYQVIAEYDNPDFSLLQAKNPHLKRRELAKIYQGFSLLKVQPKTGRTHQIRVHLSHEHHPLAGDVAYLSRAKARLDESWIPRQFLHASQLTFVHPRTGEKLTMSAALPTDLQTVLQQLPPRQSSQS